MIYILSIFIVLFDLFLINKNIFQLVKLYKEWISQNIILKYCRNKSTMYSPSNGSRSQKKLRIQDITYYSNKRQHPFSYTRTSTSNNTMNLDNSVDSLDAGSNPNNTYIYTPTNKSKSKYQVKGNKNIRKVLHQYMRQTLGDDQNQLCGVDQDDGMQVERSVSKGNARKQENTIAFGRTKTNTATNNFCDCSCECENKSRNKRSKNYGIMRQAISARIQQYKRDHKNKKLLKTHQTIQSHLQTLNGSSPSPLSPNNSSNIPTPNKNSQQLYKKLAERQNLSPKILVRFAQYERSKTLKKLQMRIQHYYKDKNRLPRAEEIVSPEKLGEMENAKKLVTEFERNLEKGQNQGCKDKRNKGFQWQGGQERQNKQNTRTQKRRQQQQRPYNQKQQRQHRQEQKRQQNRRQAGRNRNLREQKQIKIKEQNRNEKKMQENRTNTHHKTQNGHGAQNRYSPYGEQNKMGLHPIRIQNQYEDEPERPSQIQEGQAEQPTQPYPESKLQRLEQHSRQKRIEIIQSIQRERIEMVEKIKIQEQLYQQQYEYEYQLQQYERDL